MTIRQLDPTVLDALRDLGTAPDAYGPTLNTALSPSGVEAIGRALAESLRACRPTVVAVWETADEVVLAHVVARELGATVARAAELEGVVTFGSGAAPGTRVALVATAWADQRRLTTLRNLVATRGAEVVAVASVLGAPADPTAGDLPVTSLATLAEAGRP